MPPDFDNFFNDAKWRSFSVPSAYPNRLYHNADEKSAAVVAFRGAHNSWALNETAFNYIRDAVRDGRIAGGYLVLATNNPEKVVSCIEVKEATKRLDDIPIRDGKFGRFWWVESAALADAPF